MSWSNPNDIAAYMKTYHRQRYLQRKSAGDMHRLWETSGAYRKNAVR